MKWENLKNIIKNMTPEQLQQEIVIVDRKDTMQVDSVIVDETTYAAHIQVKN